jgi:hypothetical protein
VSTEWLITCGTPGQTFPRTAFAPAKAFVSRRCPCKLDPSGLICSRPGNHKGEPLCFQHMLNRWYTRALPS